MYEKLCLLLQKRRFVFYSLLNVNLLWWFNADFVYDIKIHLSTRRSSTSFSSWCPWVPQWYTSPSLDWTCFSRWLSSSSTASKVTSPNPLWLFLWGYVKDHVFVPPMPLNLAELWQRIEHAVRVLTIRRWYVYGRSWIIGSMSAESPTVGIWNTCKVCAKTLRDTLSSGTNISSISAIVTDLQIHETPEGLLTCPVYDRTVGNRFCTEPLIITSNSANVHPCL